MKKFLIFVVLALMSIFTSAQIKTQPKFRPDWFFQLPVPENATYVYTREQGEGATKQEALNKAFCQVLETTAQRLGQTVNTAAIHNAVQSGTDYNVVSRAMKIPVNKVCDFYIQDPNTHRWTAYILCQVADRGYTTHEFEPCMVCTRDSIYRKLTAEYNQYLKNEELKKKKARQREDGLALLESFFIPGLGQMMKGASYDNKAWMIEGGATLAGEVALISIGAGTFLGAKKQESVSAQYGIDYDTYANAIKQKNILYGTSYAFWGLVVVAHGVNMYRAYTLRDNKVLSFYPAIIPTINQNLAYGIGATIKF